MVQNVAGMNSALCLSSPANVFALLSLSLQMFSFGFLPAVCSLQFSVARVSKIKMSLKVLTNCVEKVLSPAVPGKIVFSILPLYPDNI